MDFSFSEEQEAVRDLARQILEDQVDADRLRAVETEEGGDRFDRRTWSKLADAGLLALVVPEEHGGSGLGLVEAALVAEQVGRTTAYVPVLPTLLGAMAVAELGSEEQKAAVLPGVAAGSTVIAPALLGDVTASDGTVSGVAELVPAGTVADVLLVCAGGAMYLVDASAAGGSITRERQDTTSGVPEARVTFDGAPAALLGGAGAVDWLTERMTAVLCVVTAGVCDRALHLTADYTKERQQFDRAIATFQAVGQRAADAYIDTEAIRLTAWQAVWRLSAGLPASKEVAIAKFWAADGGQRVVHAAQHLHGGIGVDRDYPLHRYFLWAKHLELTLGGATEQLVRLGAVLAAEPV